MTWCSGITGIVKQTHAFKLEVTDLITASFPKQSIDAKVSNIVIH